MKVREGLTNGTTSSTTTTTTTNGVAGNAASYAAAIKSMTVKLQDSLLVTKYIKDYENIVMNTDDLVDNLMLQTVLNMNPNDPKSNLESLSALNTLNDAKTSLTKVMKFIDGK